VKEFIRKLSAIWARALDKKFVEPVLIRKSLHNIGLKGRQIIGVPVAPTCLGPFLDRETIQHKYHSAS
jgi:hypothetical protein